MKSVSTFLMSAMLLASSLVQAAPSRVPEPQATELKKAIALIDFKCAAPSGYAINYDVLKDVLQTANTVFIDNSGTQPALVFINYWPNKTDRTRVSIMTSADFKSVDEMTLEEQSFQPVNNGTLLKPRIVNEFATNKTYRCWQR